MSEGEFEIVLHVYDLSKGIASGFSGPLLGMNIGGIWHSGVVVYGKEYYFGGGIQRIHPSEFLRRHNFSSVTRKHNLGTTRRTELELEQYLQRISHKYTRQTYNMLHHNCNNFADEVVRFLKDIQNSSDPGIPRYIIDLPKKVLSTPMGKSLIGPLLNQMHQQVVSNSNVVSIDQIGDPIPLKSSKNSKASFKNREYLATVRKINHIYGSNALNFFEGMEPRTRKQAFEFAQNSIFVASYTGKFEKLRSKVRTVVLLFSGEVEELKERIQPDFEVDISTVESFEELLDVCSAFLDMSDGEGCLLLSETGNDEALALGLSYVAQSNEEIGDWIQTIGEDAESYMSFRAMVDMFTILEEDSFMTMVIDLHKESPQNLISLALETQINQIQQLNLPKTPVEKIRRILRTTSGNADAAINLLLS